ncbi:hypothetical protein CTI12_AA302800 [Artemisia annua]|uniref:Uncharacterized protein n=1 Tax=Artemisia annua TaxID=35608 RepID=A0A2U1MVP3_ARTAN|nr:hypothetical protein CTI12_AA302800 [Artemisia annua]
MGSALLIKAMWTHCHVTNAKSQLPGVKADYDIAFSVVMIMIQVLLSYCHKHAEPKDAVILQVASSGHEGSVSLETYQEEKQDEFSAIDFVTEEIIKPATKHYIDFPTELQSWIRSLLIRSQKAIHGVYEEGIGEICKIIQDNRGHVYMDGTNMNAQVC